MEKTANNNLLKIVVIPLVIVLGLVGLGVAVFERVTGIGSAISAYREGEEKCRKYGLFATAEELNREYIVPSATAGGELLRAALVDYQRALVKNPDEDYKAGYKANGRPTPAQTTLPGNDRALVEFWKRVAPLRNERVLRIQRDFREGYGMLVPEYSYYRLVADNTLDTALVTRDMAEALRLLKDVAWLRTHVTDNYESDFPAMIASRILSKEMLNVDDMLNLRGPNAALVKYAKELSATNPMDQGAEFRLKVELASMFQVCDPSFPAQKVFKDMGILPSDTQFTEWAKRRKYPRIERACKSTAMDIASYGYEQLKANPPKSLDDQFMFRVRLDGRQRHFGNATATAWSPWHPFVAEDVQRINKARATLQKTLAKLP